MKTYFRIISVLLTLCLLLSVLAACKTGEGDGENTTVTTAAETTTATETTTAVTTAKQTPAEVIDERYPYTLTQQDIDDFGTLLDRCEELVLEGTQTEEIESALEEMEDAFYHIATQSQIAHLIYCLDESDEAASDEYLFASGASTDIYDEYMAMCQTIYASESPYREEFFSDWTEAEINDMLSYSPEIAELNKANDEILVSFRDLNPDQKETFEPETCRLFAKMIENNNKIAKTFKYDNYIDYAYKNVYNRDYDAEDVQQMREYVQEYLVPLCLKTYNDFYAGYQAMDSTLGKTFVNFLQKSYSSLGLNYVNMYIVSSQENIKESMNDLFTSGNCFILSSRKAHSGAFTSYLYEYEVPYCFFGPSYQSNFTVIHELGHYYAAKCAGMEDIQMDLAETQSQGNEFLFLAYLNEVPQCKGFYKTLVNYQLYNTLCTIIISTIVDEIEQYVYTHELEDPEKDIDAIVTQICEAYGGESFIDNFVTDISMYWKYVVIESPVYYISYAMSAIAAIELYCEAKDSFTDAQEIYRQIVEDVDPDAGFIATITGAGLADPFDEEAYQRIDALIDPKQ